jgi:glycosyltransferase involved in cell wall biosynthesis
MTKQTPAISIILPVRNEGIRVKTTIRSFAFRRSNSFLLEFIVVDDCSHDGCCEGLENFLSAENHGAYVRTIRLEKWSGIPFARNRGAFEANAPILFITDANIEASDNWDIPVFRDLRPDTALCATIADASSDWRGYGCALDLPSMGISWLNEPNVFSGFVPVAPSTGTILYTDLFRRIGGFDTCMPVYGAAEPEFSVRLWLYGCKIIICPDLVLMHRFRPSAERQPFLNKIEFIQIQNYLRFGLLYLDEKGIVQLLEHWYQMSPLLFADALRQVGKNNVWERRRHLKKNLKGQFESYKNYFKMAVAAG